MHTLVLHNPCVSFFHSVFGIFFLAARWITKIHSQVKSGHSSCKVDGLLGGNGTLTIWVEGVSSQYDDLLMMISWHIVIHNSYNSTVQYSTCSWIFSYVRIVQLGWNFVKTCSLNRGPGDVWIMQSWYTATNDLNGPQGLMLASPC